MKVLVVLTYYHPHWTGLTKYAKRLSEGLVNFGHDVSVLTAKHSNDLLSYETINGVNVSRKGVTFRLSRSLFSVELIISLIQEIRNNKVTVVFLPFSEVLLVSILGKIFHKKVILVHNGDLVLPKGLLNRMLEKIYYFVTEISINLAYRTVVQTEDYASSSPILKRHENKLITILPQYEVRDENIEFTIKLKEKVGIGYKYLVGFAGRFVEEKGFDFLLTAMPKILEKVPGTKFIFAGETNMVYEKFFERCKDLLDKNKDQVVILGRLNNVEMASFYKICNVFVVSSRTDCFPSTEIEALLYGVPVVVTNIPGARWPVKTTGMGLIVESENPTSLAEGVVKVLTNSNEFIKEASFISSIFDNQKSLTKFDILIRS